MPVQSLIIDFKSTDEHRTASLTSLRLPGNAQQKRNHITAFLKLSRLTYFEVCLLNKDLSSVFYKLKAGVSSLPLILPIRRVRGRPHQLPREAESTQNVDNPLDTCVGEVAAAARRWFCVTV